VRRPAVPTIGGAFIYFLCVAATRHHDDGVLKTLLFWNLKFDVGLVDSCCAGIARVAGDVGIAKCSEDRMPVDEEASLLLDRQCLVGLSREGVAARGEGEKKDSRQASGSPNLIVMHDYLLLGTPAISGQCYDGAFCRSFIMSRMEE